MSNPIFWHCFTLNHVDGQDEQEFRSLYTDLQDDLRPICEKFVFQLERGEQGRLHYQGFIHLKEKQRSSTLRSTLLTAKRQGLYIAACSDAGKAAASRYAMKADTREDGPWADKNVYMGQDLPTKLYEWQEDVRKILLGPMEDRKIYWYYDHEGNLGKSKFAKYMKFHHDVPKITFGKCSDLLNLVTKQQNKKAYIFDLSRTKSREIDMDEIYSAMENIKNGHFINTKYEVEEVLMLPPHICVFANYRPDTSKLSSDRWIIRQLGSNNDIGAPL